MSKHISGQGRGSHLKLASTQDTQETPKAFVIAGSMARHTHTSSMDLVLVHISLVFKEEILLLHCCTVPYFSQRILWLKLHLVNRARINRLNL